MKQQLLKYTTTFFIALGLSACGGGGGSASFENTNTATQIDISIPCVTNPSTTDINNYITLLSGDTISKSGDVTIITYHDSDGDKKVCVDGSSTGSAYILR
jgi:hypothetical protein